MTEEIQKPEGTVLPCIDDRAVIQDLLRAHAMAVSQRLAEASHKNVARDEVVMADRRAAAFIASTLRGLNPAYAKAERFTPEVIEANLRSALSDDLKLYEIPEAEVADSQTFMQAAMFIFTNRIHELINELTANPDTIAADGPKKLGDLLAAWTSKITGEK